MVEKALDENMIVYLPTGAGKTFIAVMLIRRKWEAITRDYPSDPKAKRSIFLAHTVPLVKQQADYLAKHTPFSVDAYFGDKRIDDRVVDFWDKTIWANELKRRQVLVMSPQIFDDCLGKGFIGIYFKLSKSLN